MPFSEPSRPEVMAKKDKGMLEITAGAAVPPISPTVIPKPSDEEKKEDSKTSQPSNADSKLAEKAEEVGSAVKAPPTTEKK